MNRALVLLILIATGLAGGESHLRPSGPGLALLQFASPCDTIKPVVARFVRNRGFVIDNVTCGDCLFLHTNRLFDADGERLSFREAQKLYTVSSLRTKMPFGFWKHDTPDGARAWLRFHSQQNLCTVEFEFELTCRYATQWFWVFPVDGDPISFRSNGLLETRYLDAISAELGRVGIRSTGPIVFGERKATAPE